MMDKQNSLPQKNSPSSDWINDVQKLFKGKKTLSDVEIKEAIGKGLVAKHKRLNGTPKK